MNKYDFTELNLTPSEEQALYYTFKFVNKLFDMLDIKYFVAFGTLIGAIRHGRRMPWDDDIDIIISFEDSLKLKEYLGSPRKKRPKISTWCYEFTETDIYKSDSGNTQTGVTIQSKSWGMPYKLWKTNTKNLNSRWGWPFVDINTYTIKNGILSVPKKELKFGHIKSFSHSVDSIFPIRKADFDGMCIPVPTSPVEILKKDFGNDILDTCIVSYNHKVTKSKFKQIYENELASEVEKFRIPIENFDSFNAKNHRWIGALNGGYCDELFYM